MFGTIHLVFLGVTLALVAVATVLSVKFKLKFKTAAIIALIIAIATEIEKIATHMLWVDQSNHAMGMCLNPDALPFHLCPIFMLIFLVLPTSKEGKTKEGLKSLLALVAPLAALCALILPETTFSYKNPDIYELFLRHGMMVWFGLYLICTKQAQTGLRAYIRNIIIMAITVFMMIWVNSIFSVYQTNYFYIVRPPYEGLPILNLNHGYAAYFFTVVALGLVAITLVHLPFIIVEAVQKKKARTQNK